MLKTAMAFLSSIIWRGILLAFFAGLMLPLFRQKKEEKDERRRQSILMWIIALGTSLVAMRIFRIYFLPN